MTNRYAARSLDQTEPTDARPAPLIWSKTLVTHYATDPDLIAAVLPKPLEMSDTPLVRINVARVDLPGLDEPLGAGVVSVTCTHEGRPGYYDLIMVMTAEQAVIGGRETYGEPKKIGSARLDVDGHHVHGVTGRRGIDYVEVDGTITEELALLPTADRTTFYFKFLLDPQGKGFDHDPALVYCTRTETQRKREAVDATVILRDSKFDPVADLPVREVVSCYLSEINTVQRGEIHSTVPGEWILPFAHQRYDHLMMQAG
jgi:acetoacetate decarboxylase